MGIAEIEAMLRVMLALLPVNPTDGGGVDGDWEGVINWLPKAVATTINLMPSQYQQRLIEALRDRLAEY